MSQWFLTYDGGRIGPLGHAQAVVEAFQHPDGHAWKEGFTEWVPIAKVAELRPPPPKLAVRPPPLAQRAADDIEFEIHGSEMQYVEIELDPGESAVAEAGAMMFKDRTVELSAVFGDGSGQDAGFMGKLLGAGKRVLTGESLFTTVFTQNGPGKARVAFAAPYPGTIIPVTLANMGGTLICQKDSFLCAAKGVSIGIHFQRKILTGLFGGEGFIMQKLEGDGLVCMHAGGTVVERELGRGESLHVDTGCLVAMEHSVDLDVEAVGGIKSAIFGGEGLFLATLTGPGKIWLQSLPFSRLAGRMLASARGMAVGKEEGSVLGTLGGILGRDTS